MKLSTCLKTLFCVLSTIAVIIAMILLAELAYRRLVEASAVRKTELEAKMKEDNVDMLAYVDSAIEFLKKGLRWLERRGNEDRACSCRI
ncbi:hypothetical protein WR25_23438 [Diploscapter pachys]|uniref:Uncharacterized protein n=1 Tax=Diploscapter pachys TaxID=2018661 RepID=A0A2A2JM45_9BILA|nr:hypothetical protein WR25_23438 [Diploscapter pachys]